MKDKNNYYNWKCWNRASYYISKPRHEATSHTVSHTAFCESCKTLIVLLSPVCGMVDNKINYVVGRPWGLIRPGLQRDPGPSAVPHWGDSGYNLNPFRVQCLLTLHLAHSPFSCLSETHTYTCTCIYMELHVTSIHLFVSDEHNETPFILAGLQEFTIRRAVYV